ncbi:MAG: hypothetical protein K0Q92_3632, partial [Steroidobacteraceae bacterium]|nr:hypothetical protein [Steroidobacteraceae bacterium]
SCASTSSTTRRCTTTRCRASGAVAPPWAACSTSSPSPRAATCAPTCRKNWSGTSRPGGTCEFDLPDFFFWLNQATDQRARSFNEWLATLRPLCDAIAELLWITRQHGKPRQEIARAGVYHITFERDTPIQLVRIALPAASGLYPETSGSHYRCSVRLLAWNGLNQRPQQTPDDVPFTLTCCT